MNRTKMHETGHALAAKQHNLEVYGFVVSGEEGECRFKGHALSKDSLIWVTLAGPAAERLFFGEPDDVLDQEFGSASDLLALPAMTDHEFLDWDDKIKFWAVANEKFLLSEYESR